MQEVGNPERRAKSARGVRGAQIVSKHALSDYADDPADQNPSADHHRVFAGAFTLPGVDALRAGKPSGRFADYGNGFSGRFGGVMVNLKSFGASTEIGR